MIKAKAWILIKHFDGFPTDNNFELKVDELSEPKNGGRVNFIDWINRTRPKQARKLKVCWNLLLSDFFFLGYCRGAVGSCVSQC